MDGLELLRRLREKNQMPVIFLTSKADELDEALGLIRRAYNELLEDGWDLSMPPIGVMVEVPAAVILAEEFAREAAAMGLSALAVTDRNSVAGVVRAHQALRDLARAGLGAVRTTDRTGVEMEALTACSVAALTVYDMCKARDRSMTIGDLALWEKSGGRSGDWTRQD